MAFAKYEKPILVEYKPTKIECYLEERLNSSGKSLSPAEVEISKISLSTTIDIKRRSLKRNMLFDYLVYEKTILDIKEELDDVNGITYVNEFTKFLLFNGNSNYEGQKIVESISFEKKRDKFVGGPAFLFEYKDCRYLVRPPTRFNIVPLHDKNRRLQKELSEETEAWGWNIQSRLDNIISLFISGDYSIVKRDV